MREVGAFQQYGSHGSVLMMDVFLKYNQQVLWKELTVKFEGKHGVRNDSSSSACVCQDKTSPDYVAAEKLYKLELVQKEILGSYWTVK